MPKTPREPLAGGLSARALATPEPFVRLFARRVQQEGALDLTQGDYKNADFAPHPEVVRAAQRITRNTVHSYGPAVGRMDVRSEVAEFFNRDGLLDYPDSEVRFQPDEVLFTPGHARRPRDRARGARRRRLRRGRAAAELGVRLVHRARRQEGGRAADRGARSSCPTRRNSTGCSPGAASPRSSSTTRTTRPGASTRANWSRSWCGSR